MAFHNINHESSLMKRVQCRCQSRKEPRIPVPEKRSRRLFPLRSDFCFLRRCVNFVMHKFHMDLGLKLTVHSILRSNEQLGVGKFPEKRLEYIGV